MTSVDVLLADTIPCPARTALPSKPTDPGIKSTDWLPEILPSPPESSAKLEQQQSSADVHFAPTAVPADTPILSPVSCTASSEGGPEKLRKRVDFSPWTASTDLTDPESSIRSLPPSRECQSSKSILKPGRPSFPVEEEACEQPKDLVTMLDTILQQLASADGQLRLDAYLTLCSALKAYAELPNGHITKEKTQALVAYIRTDLTPQSEDPMEPSEARLMLQALKLLVTVVWNKPLSAHLTNSDRSFILDHSSRMIDEHKMPKAVILHYLHLLSTQEFSSKIMTTGRAVRILEVVKDLPDHVRGNGVISERIMVYQRILEQAKGVFKSKPALWAVQVLAAMTASVADTRNRAIALGHRVAIALGSSSIVATALRDLLEASSEHEDTFSSTLCKRLVKMTKTADETVQVPQIWGVVMLLMSGLQKKFSEWQHLHDWLRIIQKCFNCTDAEVRVEANKAWNKIVYIARPYEGTRSFLSKMLMKPILVQLERPNNERQSKSTRKSAFATYCNLLYYSFKPSSSFSHYDAVWDKHIVPAFQPPFLSSEENSDRACRILLALFWRERIIPWRETRALDATIVEPEELPLLDCKWTRSRTGSILEVFELLFRFSCWGPSSHPDTAYIAVAWRNFAKALSDACCKEVRPSIETTEAVNHIARFVTRICQKGSAAVKGSDEDYVGRFHFIIKTILSEIGPTPFSEGAWLSAIHGSTIGSSTSNGQARPLMIDILGAIQDMPENCNDEAYSDMVVDLMQLTSKARASTRGRIQFYKQCAAAVIPDGSDNLRCRLTWNAISNLACAEVSTGVVNPLGDTADAENIVADVIEILELGVPYRNGQSEAWPALLKQLFLLAASSRRSGLSIIERLTKCLRHHISDEGGLCAADLIQAIIEVLNASASSENRNLALKATKKNEAEIKSEYHQAVSLIDVHLSRIYGLVDRCDEAVFQSVIDATISLLQACTTEYTLAYLTEMQASLALWLADEKRLITTTSHAGSLKLVQARRLCPVVIDVLEKLSDEVDVRSLDRLFAAAFRTSHRIVVNQTVKMWNSAYGTKKNVEYGDLLKEALARLIPFVDLELPGLDNLGSHGTIFPTLDYLETREDEHRAQHSDKLTESRVMEPQTVLPTVDNGVLQEQPVAIDAARTRTPAKAGFRPVLRHDDSQVQFVSIESSPLPGEDLESQCLTARQKEVRERQDHEAALLFPDLRSGPACKTDALETTGKSSSFVLAGAEHDPFESTDLATPTLPSRNGVSYENTALLSPTPRSKQQALRLEEIDVPSSPLSIQGRAEENQRPGTLLTSRGQNEVQSQTPNPRAAEVELIEDSPVRSSILGEDITDAFPKETEQPTTVAPLRKVGHEQLPMSKRPSDYSGGEIANMSENLPTSEPQVEDEMFSVMQATGVEIVTTDYPLVAGHSELSSEQSPVVAGCLMNIANNTADLVMTESAPQTDGSNEKHTKTTFKTPIRAGSLPEEHMNIHSDNNDFWSASQLKQDLERVASLRSAQSPILKQQSDPAFSAPVKRKRPQETSQGSKRRKTNGSVARPRESPRLLSENSKQHSSQAVYDCIEVESPSISQWSSQAESAASQTSVMSQVLKRGRGRPKRIPAPSTMPSQDDVRNSFDASNQTEGHEPIPKPKVEVCIPTNGGSRLDLSQVSTRSDETSIHQTESSDRVLNAASASNRNSAPARGSTEVKTDDKENQASPEEAMELLQKALSTLRSINMDRSDLRAIDDLVFEIRTEAQHAAQRSDRRGT